MKKQKGNSLRSAKTKKVALPRFQREHWDRWLEVAADRESWKASFDEWQSEAEGRAERLRAVGLKIVWIDLEPDSFVEWCNSRGYENDVEARNRFASEKIGNIPLPDDST